MDFHSQRPGLSFHPERPQFFTFDASSFRKTPLQPAIFIARNSTMICDVCNDMLHWHKGRQWRGMFDLQFDHHADEQSLKDSVYKHCGICQNISRELLRLKPEDRSSSPGVRGEVEAQSPFISAYLSQPFGVRQEGVYRLDFKLRDAGRVGSFVLQQRSASSNQCPFSQRVLTKNKIRRSIQ